MKTTTSTHLKILEFCDMLPDCCEPFLMATGTESALTTRLAYARELVWFFDYLINYNPEFCELKRKSIELNDIKKITSQDISRYLTIHKDQGLAERTLARKRAALSSFFSYLSNNQQIPFNPVLAAAKVKIHQSDEVVHLTMEEQDILLNAIANGTGLDNNKLKYHDKYKKRDSALVMLFLDTGMRISELHAVDIIDVDLSGCSIIVTRKGGNHQHIYFSNTARDLLAEYIEERKLRGPVLSSDPLFVTLQNKRLAVRSIEVLVKKYVQAALPGKGNTVHVHTLRSSFAMAFYDASGKDLLSLQRKLGHRSLAATNIYAKATDKAMYNSRSLLRP